MIKTKSYKQEQENDSQETEIDSQETEIDSENDEEEVVVIHVIEGKENKRPHADDQVRRSKKPKLETNAHIFLDDEFIAAEHFVTQAHEKYNRLLEKGAILEDQRNNLETTCEDTRKEADETRSDVVLALERLCIKNYFHMRQQHNVTLQAFVDATEKVSAYMEAREAADKASDELETLYDKQGKAAGVLREASKRLERLRLLRQTR